MAVARSFILNSYWGAVLDEVENKADHSYAFYYTNASVSSLDQCQEPSAHYNKSLLKTYYLGKEYPGVYFTRREAQCISLCMQGASYDQIAEQLGLSSRTIEFYFKNMKIKVKCKSKKDLIKSVQCSEFHMDDDMWS